MSFTPYNAPLLGPLLGEREAASCFGIKEEIQAILAFEASLARAQEKLGMVGKAEAHEILTRLDGFEPDLGLLAAGSARDGVIVPALLDQVRNGMSDTAAQALHLHATSQDVIDSSAMIRMKNCHANLQSRIRELSLTLETLIEKNGENTLMAHTRMQPALETPAGERIRSWLQRVDALIDSPQKLVFPLQLSGPIGSANSYGGKRQELAKLMATDLGLDTLPQGWQNDRQVIVEIGNWLSLVTGQLGKMGADITLMAQMGEDHIALSGGGGSSAMAHKKNPVLAETLVTLARFNATQVSGLHHALVHEQERSGSAWMLEWMIIPQVFVACAAALRNAVSLVRSIERIGLPS